jgi:alpha-N-arabinofuranosidase
VNVIGAIKTSRTAATLDTTGVVLKLYRERFGTIPVEIAGTPEPLDVAAAWRENGRGFTVSILNPTRSEQALDLRIDGVTVPRVARLSRVTGSDERAFNAPGKAPQVGVQTVEAEPFSSRIAVPPMSASLYELAVARPK